MIDGAMGTMIQSHKLQEEDFRGEEKGRVCSVQWDLAKP